MFQGSMVALVTPMDEHGEIDYGSLAQLVEFHIDNRSDAIVAVGTTGESATLDHNEHCQVIQAIINQAAGRVKIIAGTGANCTAEALQLTRCAADMGADAALLVTPYYNKPTQEGLFRHFRLLADAVPIPQILYNVPSRTGCDMQNSTVEQLADIDNIVAIKDATGDMARGADLIQRLGDRMAVFSGDDATTLELMRLGAKGCISVTANVAPRQMHNLCQAALKGDFEQAEQINQQLLACHKELFAESNPIPVKWALHRMGLISTGIRLPLTQLSHRFHAQLTDALQQAGVLT
ncbi:4-hydroxy-tetrahydrodipicolinate synthase [Ectothiorhodospiraceae bacterium BW-2]|nr:4-hydroxy-tetrahydrodipicolinate synthase [Ectothiorhodospiraceae bacterium BW-2]